MTEPAKQAPVAPTPKGHVAVRAPDGSIGTVPSDQLAQALDAGAQVVTPEAFEQAKVQARYGDAAGQGVAWGAGVARGLSFGLSDQAAVALGGDEVRRDLAGVKEANPLTSIGGELFGAAAPVGLTAGAAAAPEGLTVGRAVRGLGALPRGVAAIGSAAERAVARGVGEGIVGRGISTAAAGAAEGAFYGAGGAVSEAALGDHELTAEQLLAGAKGGAIGGALLGGGAGLLGGALVRGAAPAARDIEAVAARHLGDATPGLGEAVRSSSKLDAAAEAYIAKAADTPEQAKTLADAWRRRAEIFGKHEDLLENSTRKVTEHLDAAVKAERVVDMAAFGEAKEGQMARLVESKNWREAKEASLAVWQDTKNVVDELMADPARGGSGVAVNRAAKWLESFEKKIGETALQKDKTAVARELFTQLDDFKRAVGQSAMFGKGPFGLPEAAREFDALYNRIKTSLEDEAVWGKAAVAQREVNAATEARLATRRQFGSAFTTQYGSEAGRPLYVANPEGAASYVRNLTSAKNDLKHRAIQDYIANEQRFLDTVSKHYALGPKQQAEVANARKAFGGLQQTVDSTAKEITTVNQLRRLQESEQAGGVGGLIGLATDVATRPMKTLERLAMIEQQTRRIDETLRKGVRAVFTRAEATPTASREPLADEFTRVVKGVRAVTMTPEATADHVARTVGDLGTHAPKTAGQVSMVASRAAAFLATKMPVGRTRETLTPHLEEPRVSDMEKSRFLRYARAANDPTTVVHDMASGRVTREGVEAMREVYPRLYERTQQHLVEQLSTLKKPLPHQKEVQLKIFLGRPVASAGMMPTLERVFAENDNARGNSPPPARPLNFHTDGVKSASERIEER